MKKNRTSKWFNIIIDWKNNKFQLGWFWWIYFGISIYGTIRQLIDDIILWF